MNNFVESDYQSDSLSRDGGRKLKRFYNEFCQHVFLTLTLCENERIQEFPIIYNERANSAGITTTLSLIQFGLLKSLNDLSILGLALVAYYPLDSKYSS